MAPKVHLTLLKCNRLRFENYENDKKFFCDGGLDVRVDGSCLGPDLAGVA